MTSKRRAYHEVWCVWIGSPDDDGLPSRLLTWCHESGMTLPEAMESAQSLMDCIDSGMVCIDVAGDLDIRIECGGRIIRGWRLEDEGMSWCAAPELAPL